MARKLHGFNWRLSRPLELRQAADAASGAVVGRNRMLSVNNTTNGALQVSHLFADDLGSIRWHRAGDGFPRPMTAAGFADRFADRGSAR
jgi:hypothetical protein